MDNDYLTESVALLQHIKCNVIKNSRQRLEILQANKSYLNDKPSKYQHIINNGKKLLILLITIILYICGIAIGVNIIQNMVIRCQQFGARKCYFPYDIHPDIFGEIQYMY